MTSTARRAGGVLLIAAVAGCGGVRYPYHDVDRRDQARAALSGCAARLDDWRPVAGAHAVDADVDGDARPDRVALAYRYRRDSGERRTGPPGLRPAERRALAGAPGDEWVGLLVGSADGRVRRVTVREARGNAGYVANALDLQTVEGRLYAWTQLDVWRVDGRALRAGRLGPPFAGLEDFGPTGWAVSQLTVLADCQGAGRDAVLLRAYREGRAERCGSGGGDVHAPRQFGLWAVTPTTRLLVRSRAEDAVLGCNS